jgi:tetratricopeptide (TPR) repeat protein
MATAAFADPGPEMALTRREILERYAVLAEQGHAQVLGLGRGADPAAVKAAYVRLVRRYHPDRARLAEAELREKLQAIFIRINEAYRALGAGCATGPDLRPLEGRVKEPPLGRKRHAADPPAPAPPPAEPTAPRSAGSLEDAVREEERRRKRVEDGLEEAEALLARGDVEGAVGALHGVLVQAKGVSRRRARLLLARAYTSDARWQRYAVQLLREMVQETPGDAEALALQGALFLREGLLARAESTLGRALASDPGNAAACAQMRAVRAARERVTRVSAEPKQAKTRLLARLLAWRE